VKFIEDVAMDRVMAQLIEPSTPVSRNFNGAALGDDQVEIAGNL
jgi:hypothetical protein